jgi:hypothetical protein
MIADNIEYIVLDFLRPILYTVIDFMNNQLPPDERLVVAGGEALQYIIPDESLKTSDIDIRVMNSKNPFVVSDHVKYMISILSMFQKHFVVIEQKIREKQPNFLRFLYTTTTLNRQTGKMEQIFSEFKTSLFSYTFFEELGNLMYAFEYIDETGTKIQHAKSIVDIISYSSTKINHIFYTLHPSISILYTPSFLKETNVLFFKLGFLLWDMINLINNIKSDDPKLPRYMKKYKTILHALDSPEKYIACDTIEPLIKKCSSQEICSVNDEVFSNKEILGESLMKSNLLPPSKDFSDKIIQTNSMRTLCSLAKLAS